MDQRSNEIFNMGMGIAKMYSGIKEAQKQEAHARNVNNCFSSRISQTT